MTNEFKTNLFNWLTGKYNPGSSENIPRWWYYNNSLYGEPGLYDLFPYGYNVTDIIQGKDNKGNDLNLNIIYGNYAKTEHGNINNGFILICDSSLKQIQVITKYSSGVDIGVLNCLYVSEDGTLYGIDGVEENGAVRKRFILLNNILIKSPNETDYKAIIRTTYNLPDEIKNRSRFQIVKKSATGTYLIVSDGVLAGDGVIFSEFQIQVGAPNVWTHYTYSGTRYVEDIYASWSDTGFIFKGIYTLSDIEPARVYYNEIVITNDNPTPTLNTIQVFDESDPNYYIETELGYFGESLKSMIINNEKAYLTFEARKKTNDDYYFLVYEINPSNSSTTFLKEILDDSAYGHGTIDFKKKNGYGFISTHEYYASVRLETIYIIINNNIIGYYLYKAPLYSDMWTINYQNNLITIVDRTDYDEPNSMESETIFMVYNPYNYNGQPFVDYNAMVPNSVYLYDEYNDIIFAKNLYNKVIQNNTTISTCEIPNSFGNGVDIVKEYLVGDTNQIIVENAMSILTNIYEEIMLNFINTINIINENNPNNAILNPIGASRLNNSVSNEQVLDYNNSKIGKYRINYEDETSQTYSINENMLTIDGLSAVYAITLYNDNSNKVLSVDLLSNDGNTIYQHITLNFENTGFYTIRQRMEVV